MNTNLTPFVETANNSSHRLVTIVMKVRPSVGWTVEGAYG
jgi:hypothetical protein